MLLNFLRVAEPYLKAFSQRVISPWKGNHVKCNDLGQVIVPWGFLTQREVLEKVSPARSEGRVEKRAESLELNMQEFLRGTEVAYRSIAQLFAAHSLGHGEHPRLIVDAVGDASGVEEVEAGEIESRLPRPTSEEGGSSDVRVGAEGARGSGTLREGESTDAEGEASGDDLVPFTDFLELSVASPQMSLFLNDVLDSYRQQRLIPRLSIKSVEAKLCNLGVRLGGINKNTNFLGSMSAEEARYHLTMGMLGPEGVLINELEGNAPQKVIADVRLTCEEEFVLEDGSGNVVHRNDSKGPVVHFLTLQSNIEEGGRLEWQVTNINDVIKPNLDYYFSRFGH